MSQTAPCPRPDLADAYWSKFNAWQFLQASVPKAHQKPDWKAIHTYPIARRLAHRGKLIAIRPNTSTQFLVLDLDALSRYHPKQNPYAIPQLQQALEERLGLVTCIPSVPATVEEFTCGTGSKTSKTPIASPKPSRSSSEKPDSCCKPDT